MTRILSWLRRQFGLKVRRPVARDYLGPDPRPPAPSREHVLTECLLCGKRQMAATGVPLALMRCLGCNARMDGGRTGRLPGRIP